MIDKDILRLTYKTILDGKFSHFEKKGGSLELIKVGDDFTLVKNTIIEIINSYDGWYFIGLFYNGNGYQLIYGFNNDETQVKESIYSYLDGIIKDTNEMKFQIVSKINGNSSHWKFFGYEEQSIRDIYNKYGKQVETIEKKYGDLHHVYHITLKPVIDRKTVKKYIYQKFPQNYVIQSDKIDYVPLTNNSPIELEVIKMRFGKDTLLQNDQIILNEELFKFRLAVRANIAKQISPNYKITSRFIPYKTICYDYRTVYSTVILVYIESDELINHFDLAVLINNNDTVMISLEEFFKKHIDKVLPEKPALIRIEYDALYHQFDDKVYARDIEMREIRKKLPGCHIEGCELGLSRIVGIRTPYIIRFPELEEQHLTEFKKKIDISKLDDNEYIYNLGVYNWLVHRYEKIYSELIEDATPVKWNGNKYVYDKFIDRNTVKMMISKFKFPIKLAAIVKPEYRSLEIAYLEKICNEMGIKVNITNDVTEYIITKLEDDIYTQYIYKFRERDLKNYIINELKKILDDALENGKPRPTEFQISIKTEGDNISNLLQNHPEFNGLTYIKTENKLHFIKAI